MFHYFTREIFYFYLSRDDCRVTLGHGEGAEDTCEGIDFYLPNTFKKYWQFAVEEFALGGVKAPSGQVVVATTKKYIGMPKRFLKEFTSKHSIPWDGLYGAYTVDCFQINSLPPLNFKVDGGVLTIRAPQYVYTQFPLPNGRCVLDFEDSKAFGFGPEWYIGFHLLRDYCTLFDLKKNQMGFKTTLLTDPCNLLSILSNVFGRTINMTHMLYTATCSMTCGFLRKRITYANFK